MKQAHSVVCTIKHESSSGQKSAAHGTSLAMCRGGLDSGREMPLVMRSRSRLWLMRVARRPSHAIPTVAPGGERHKQHSTTAERRAPPWWGRDVERVEPQSYDALSAGTVKIRVVMAVHPQACRPRLSSCPRGIEDSMLFSLRGALLCDQCVWRLLRQHERTRMRQRHVERQVQATHARLLTPRRNERGGWR